MYPTGAGPTAGQFSGTVWQPTEAADQAAGIITSSARPSIANAAAELVDGRMVAAFTAPVSTAWLVRRIVVQSEVPGRALVYVGTLIPENVISGTVSGEFDENDANQPYLVPESETLSVVWDNPGMARARIEYTEV